MNEAAAAPDAPLGRAVRALAERTADKQIGEALDALIAKRDELRRWMENAAPDGEAGSIDDALADLRGRLGLGRDETRRVGLPRDLRCAELEPRRTARRWSSARSRPRSNRTERARRSQSILCGRRGR